MTIPQAFALALQRHQAGRLAEAEALYRQILAAQPNHADALHLLGVISHQAGRHDLAVEWIRQALVIHANNPIAYSNLGEAYRALGRLDEAIAAHRRALALKPDLPKSHLNLGVALRERGQLDEAIAAYRRALELAPGLPETHNNLGIALMEQGQPADAAAAYRRAIALQPDYSEAHNNLGAALAGAGQLDDAIAVYRRALALKPDFAEAHNNLASALRERGHFEEAIAACRRALELRPGIPEAYNNLGAALAGQGRLDEALSAYHRAIEIKPDYPEAHDNLGHALKDHGQLDAALEAYRRALRIKPDNASHHSDLLFALHYHPGQTNSTISEEHQRWNRRFSDPLKKLLLPHANERSLGRKLRVGYVSPDFRDHPVGRYALSLLARHDRAQFEILCYSGVATPDWMTERFRALAVEWRNTVRVSDTRLEEMIREDRVDILVDLAMHTPGNRLPVFARQPAPLQVTWLAYPGGSDLPGIGYRLTDARMDPPGSHSRDLAGPAEEPVRLPDCWCCYDPIGESPEVNPLPALSDHGVTFGALNNFAKVNEGVLALWAQALEAVRGSRLVMLCPEGQARERVRAFFGARGIDPRQVEFVGLLPRWEHLKLYQRIDIALDPFPYNGMATTCDALWMGVPVLTLPGELPISRAGLSLLSSVGLEALAASSAEDFVRIAVERAADLPRLAELRATLRPGMQSSPLMDAPQFARNVEAAYRSMWERWCERPIPNARII